MQTGDVKLWPYASFAERHVHMLIVGDRDIEAGTVSPRHRADGDLGAMSVDEFSALLKRVVDNKEQK